MRNPPFPIPANPEAERFVLGFLLLDDSAFPSALERDAFSNELHRRVWGAMVAVRARGDRIDVVGIYGELQRSGSTQPNILSLLNDLTEGVPVVGSLLDQHVRTLRDFAARRRVIAACQNLSNRAAVSEDLNSIIAAGQKLFTGGGIIDGGTYRSIEEIPTLRECGNAEIEYVHEPELPRAAVVAFTGDSGSGKSTLLTALARDASRKKGIPTLFLDRENPLAVIADRLGRLGMEDGPGIKFWGGWLPEQAPQPDAPIVRAWAAATKGIVVVDSFSAFIEGDQNDAANVRAFMNRMRGLADLGATPVVTHHDGKADTAKDYRGSSDFKAAIDQGYHVTNIAADGGGLGKLVLRPFKSRLGVVSPIMYNYAGGNFDREDAADRSEKATETLSEQFAQLLRLNPGATARRFDDLLKERGLPRQTGRAWLDDAVLARTVRREQHGRGHRHFYVGPAQEAFEK